jgi:hypothetical protein
MNNTRTVGRLVVVAALALLATACGAPAEVASTTTSPAAGAPAPVRVPVGDASDTPITDVPELVDDLAGELNVSTDEVTIVTDDEVVWPDGSLGCPEPEVSYTMATVPGRRVVLESGGLTYTYHSSLDGGFFLCVEPQPPDEIPTPTTGVPVEPTDLRTAADAILALAARLGVSTDGIRVVSEENVTWPDGSIGCPQPGMSYTQALVDGRRVVLVHDGVEYHYHGAQNGPLFYCASPSDPVADGGGGGYGDT